LITKRGRESSRRGYFCGKSGVYHSTFVRKRLGTVFFTDETWVHVLDAQNYRLWKSENHHAYVKKLAYIRRKFNYDVLFEERESLTRSFIINAE